MRNPDHNKPPSKLRGYRRRAGLLQVDLADFVNYERSMISKLESGTEGGSDRIWRDLAAARSS